MKTQNLTGLRFGRLVVKEIAETNKMRTRWICQCDCGRQSIVVAYSLTSGKQISCGCFKRERLGKSSKKHGHSVGRKTTREYQSWSGAKKRCCDPKNDKYSIYGARGISICDRWKDSFENFFLDMGACPPGHSIDRINNDGNYEPGNCRWATAKEQVRNRSNTIRMEWDGRLMTIAEICEAEGIRYGALYKAVFLRGNPLNEAIKRLHGSKG